MTAETFALWRDLALILLIAEAFILVLPVAILLFFGWKYLRKGRKALYMPMLMAQVYALRIQHITMRVTDKIATVPINVSAASAQVTTAVGTLTKGTPSKGKTDGSRNRR